MTLAIRHTTSYTYDDNVFLNPQTIRLQPRSDAAQRLHHFALSITPEPAGCSHGIDLEGSPATLVWFEYPTRTFVVGTESIVETLNVNPFNFLLTASTLLPAHPEELYSPTLRAALKPYLTELAATQFAQGSIAWEQRECSELAHTLALESKRDLVSFLMNATEWLHRNIEPEVRLEGAPRPAAETLRRRRGSCRDVAVVLMDVCRTHGLATRFVSGYCTKAVSVDERQHSVRHLHAWVEVYVEGAGWRGFDPSYGCIAGEQHIACAAAATPALAAPVSGMYQVYQQHQTGTNDEAHQRAVASHITSDVTSSVTSRLEYHITIEPVSYLHSSMAAIPSMSSPSSTSALYAAQDDADTSSSHSSSRSALWSL
jgi:transglutaminase-like putative cysteine protease